MSIHKRPFHFLLLAILLGGLSGYTINFYPPDFAFLIFGFALPLFPFVAAGASATIFFLTAYLFNSSMQGLLLTVFTAIYLILRYVGLKNIFFFILLLALLGSLEIFFFKKK